LSNHGNYGLSLYGRILATNTAERFVFAWHLLKRDKPSRRGDFISKGKMALYDRIGKNYTQTRKCDRRKAYC
jgi:hypothetical protein